MLLVITVDRTGVPEDTALTASPALSAVGVTPRTLSLSLGNASQVAGGFTANFC